MTAPSALSPRQRLEAARPPLGANQGTHAKKRGAYVLKFGSGHAREVADSAFVNLRQGRLRGGTEKSCAKTATAG